MRFLSRVPFRVYVATCAIVAVFLGASAFALAIYAESQTANNSVALQSLLLNGHTASAISAKQTKEEVASLNQAVGLLVSQQQFDHTQAVDGQKRLRAVIRQVESHLDHTIERAISRAATRTVKQLR